MEGTLDPEKVKGKILACLRGVTGRLDKGKQAALAGAVGMILCNAELDGNETVADAYALPASHIDYADGVALFAYINSTEYVISLFLLIFVLICLHQFYLITLSLDLSPRPTFIFLIYSLSFLN